MCVCFAFLVSLSLSGLVLSERRIDTIRRSWYEAYICIHTYLYVCIGFVHVYGLLVQLNLQLKNKIVLELSLLCVCVRVYLFGPVCVLVRTHISLSFLPPSSPLLPHIQTAADSSEYHSCSIVRAQ